jgi:hypothetical protein
VSAAENKRRVGRYFAARRTSPWIQSLERVPVWLPLRVVILVAASLGVAAAAALPEGAAQSSWTSTERIAGPEGYRLFRSDFRDSDFPAYRLEATIEASAAAVAAAFRKNLVDPSVSPKNVVKTVLRAREGVIVLYSYIEVPLFSDRDVTTRVARSLDSETGIYRFEWQATDVGPPPVHGVVRLQESSGSWVFTPLADGRTSAVCESHTEIGGVVPAWLVNSFTGDTVVDGLVLLRARVERDKQRMAAESLEQGRGVIP